MYRTDSNTRSAAPQRWGSIKTENRLYFLYLYCSSFGTGGWGLSTKTSDIAAELSGVITLNSFFEKNRTLCPVPRVFLSRRIDLTELLYPLSCARDKKSISMELFCLLLLVAWSL